MESFLDHEVTIDFVLFQSSLRVCNLQADQSQDLLCVMECDCWIDCELCGQEGLQSIQVLQEHTEGLAKYLDNKLKDKDWSNLGHIPDGVSLHIRPPTDI